MESTKVKEIGELRQFISFSVGAEEYGLELLRVKEVIRMRDKFGLKSREDTGQTRVIVVELEGRLTGLVVDSASQVVRIPADQIDPPPPVPGGFTQDLITGVAKLEDRLVILLNPDEILTVDEKTALSSMDVATAIERAAPDDGRPLQE